MKLLHKRPEPLPLRAILQPPPKASCKHSYVFIETKFSTLDNGHTTTLDRFYCKKCLDIVEK